MQLSFTETQALTWTQRFIALALIQQSFEFLLIQRELGPGGSWSWAILKRDFEFFPKPLVLLFEQILNGLGFKAVLLVQLVASFLGLLAPAPIQFFILFFTHSLICLRWRGTFNGGSDFMTLVVLTALVLSGMFGQDSGVVRLALIYIALHSISSYLIAGVAKLSKPSWRSGQALRTFLTGSNLSWLPGPVSALVLTFGILSFECSFPVAVFRPEFCLLYMSLALLFHLMNAAVLGLNRFVLPWAATYPALLFLSQFRPLG
jgi:hypothetical protein